MITDEEREKLVRINIHEGVIPKLRIRVLNIGDGLEFYGFDEQDNAGKPETALFEVRVFHRTRIWPHLTHRLYDHEIDEVNLVYRIMRRA